jgi:hypothetical protein
MKVSRRISRKVGRRSHSSISRRRLRNKKSKSGYKKKYAKTQKGGTGKHGKHGRGHKRSRTHKHGKRFHRGGRYQRPWEKTIPVVVEGMNNEGEIVFNYTGQIGSKQIYLKNIRYLKGPDKDTRIDDFIVEITYTANNKILTIHFFRQDDSKDVLSFYLPSSKRDNNVDNVLEELKGMERGILVVFVNYSFNETNNYRNGNGLFQKLSNAISKAVTQYEKTYQDSRIKSEIRLSKEQTSSAQHLQKQGILPIETFKSRPAPPGWVKRFDEDGIYYETTDENPTRVSRTYPEDDSEASGALTAPSVSDSSESDAGVGSGIDIGDGWIMYMDKGMSYYHNSKTDQVTWDDPRLSSKDDDDDDN